MIIRRDKERMELDCAIAPGTKSRKNGGGEAVMAAVPGKLVNVGLLP